MKRLSLLLLAAACGWTAAASAADIYRWVDKDGKVHLSDKPPPGRPDAEPLTNSKRYEVTPAERKAAQDRAAKDKAAVQAIESARKGEAAQRAASAASASKTAEGKPPAPPSNESACERQWRDYEASQGCFAPYRLANGGLRPEAREKCGADVPTPSCARR